MHKQKKYKINLQFMEELYGKSFNSSAKNSPELTLMLQRFTILSPFIINFIHQYEKYCIYKIIEYIYEF